MINHNTHLTLKRARSSPQVSCTWKLLRQEPECVLTYGAQKAAADRGELCLGLTKLQSGPCWEAPRLCLGLAKLFQRNPLLLPDLKEWCCASHKAHSSTKLSGQHVFMTFPQRLLFSHIHFVITVDQSCPPLILTPPAFTKEFF